MSSRAILPRAVIAVDMDEVIADALGEHLLRYNRHFAAELAEPLTRAHLHGRYIWDAVPAARLATLEAAIAAEDFFRNLPVLPHAQRVLARLQSRYEIFIATAAMEVPGSFTAKYEWLGEHFPFIPPSHIVFCGDKSILRADFLIDDNPRQLRLFEGRGTQDLSSRPTGGSGEARPEHAEGTPVFTSHGNTTPEGILFSSPANANVSGFRRVNDWLDVEKMFLP